MLLSIAQEKTPAAAAEAFVTGTKATVVKSDSGQVNGLPAQRLVVEVESEQGTLRAVSYFIQKDN